MGYEPRKNPSSSISRIEKDNTNYWLAYANVNPLNSSNVYIMNPLNYMLRNYYLRPEGAQYWLYKEGYDKLAKNVTPDLNSIPGTIYPHTCSYYKNYLSEYLINILDSMITIGDMPDKGSFGVSSWLKKGGDIQLEDRMITFWMSYLKSWIPVVVVDEETMSKHDVDYCDPNEPEGNHLEILGLYLPKSELYKVPCIVICLERIKKSAENLKISYRNLCIIVLLHELAHAIMDYTNDLGKIESDDGESYTFVKNDKVELDIFKKNNNVRRAHFAMEESLANMIMLRYCKCYCKLHKGSKLLREAKIFVGQQSRSYRFGLKQFEAAGGEIDWSKWRDAKSGTFVLDPNKLATWNSKFVVIEAPYSVSEYNKIFKENIKEENSKED